MSKIDFDTFPKDCPSELKLDQLELGELSPEESQQLYAQIDGSPASAEVMKQREVRTASLETVDREAMLNQILGAVEHRVAVESTPWWTQVVQWLQRPTGRNFVMAGAVCAAAALFLTIGLDVGPSQDEIRLKGAAKPKLNVYRERGGQVVEVMQNDVLRAGDRLRFGVHVPQARGQFMIVGVESNGERFAYYPMGEEKSLEMKTVDEAAALDATVELDESKGREGIYLVWCPKVFELGSIRVSKDGEGLRVPKACNSTGIEVLKE